MANRNFARGEAPPSHSYEWAGVAKPPQPSTSAGAAKATGGRPGIPVMIAVSETIVVKKRRPWLWAAAGAVVGFFLGHKTASY